MSIVNVIIGNKPIATIHINEKFYMIVFIGGWSIDGKGTPPSIVRRDVYWDSGYKDPIEIEKIQLIEAYLEDLSNE